MMFRTSLSTLYLTALYCIQPTLCKTITWLPSGSGDLHNIGNWDSSTLPTVNDDVIIKINNENNLDTVITLNQGDQFKARSITAAGKFLLDIESTLNAVTISLSNDVTMKISGSELSSSMISVDKSAKLMLDSVVVQGQNLQLNVKQGGTLNIGSEQSSNSDSTATHFINTVINNGGTGVWYSGALILDNSQIVNNGQFTLHGAMLNSGGSNDHSSVHNAGTMSLEPSSSGDNAQLVGIQVFNQGKLNIAGSSDQSTVRVLNTISVENGELHIVNGKTLLFGANNHTIGSGATVINDGILQMESGATVSNGKLIGTGSYLVHAALYLNGITNIPGDITIKSGQVALNAGNTTVGTLNLVSGTISGVNNKKSVIDVLNQFNVIDTSASKVLSSVGINIHGSGDVNSNTALLMFESSTLTVLPKATMSLHTSSAINSDATASSIKVLKDGQLSLGGDSTDTSTSNRKLLASSIDANSVSVAVGIDCDGIVSVTGDATLKSSSQIQDMKLSDGAVLHLQGSGDNTQFKFLNALSLPSENSQLICNNVKLLLDSAQQSNINALSLFDSTLIAQASLQFNKLELGSPKSNSNVQCNVDIITNELQYDAGDITCKTLTVNKALTIQGLSSKTLNMNKLLLNGQSSITGTTLKLVESMIATIAPNAILSIGPTTTIDSVQFDTTGGKDSKHPKLINNNILEFTGSNSGSSTFGLHIDNNGLIRINNHQTVQLNSLVHSSDTSKLQLNDNSIVTLNCPTNATTVCTWQQIDAPDSTVVVNLGPHDMFNSINASTLTVAGGTTRVFKPVTVTEFNMQLGELTTHNHIDIQQFKYTGGTLRGYSSLGSAIIIYDTADIAHSNDVALDGINLYNTGTLLYHGADMVLSNNAQITNTNKMSIKSNSNFYSGNADSGRIVNFGTLDVMSPTLHVALINNGILTVNKQQTLTLLDRYDQTTANAALYNNGNIIKENSVLAIASGTLYDNGNIQSNVDINGRLVLNNTAKVDGDVVFSPNALFDSAGHTLEAKTVYLAGTADLNGAFDAIKATKMYNAFDNVNQDVNQTSTILAATGHGTGYKSSTATTNTATWDAPKASDGTTQPVGNNAVYTGIGTVGSTSETAGHTDTNKPANKPDTSKQTATSNNSHQLNNVSVLGMDPGAAQSALLAFIVLFVLSAAAAITLGVLYYRQRQLTKTVV